MWNDSLHQNNTSNGPTWQSTPAQATVSKSEPNISACPNSQEPCSQSHEWYQTDSEVVLSVFVKNTKPEHVNCEFGPRSISLNYKLPTNATEGCFDLDPLSYEIDPSQSSCKSLSSKIELSFDWKSHQQASR